MGLSWFRQPNIKIWYLFKACFFLLNLWLPNQIRTEKASQSNLHMLIYILFNMHPIISPFHSCSAAAQANDREQKESNILKWHSTEPLHSKINITFQKLLCMCIAEEMAVSMKKKKRTWQKEQSLAWLCVSLIQIPELVIDVFSIVNGEK